jgi:hypothetical protein
MITALTVEDELTRSEVIRAAQILELYEEEINRPAPTRATLPVAFDPLRETMNILCYRFEAAKRGLRPKTFNLRELREDLNRRRRLPGARNHPVETLT